MMRDRDQFPTQVPALHSLAYSEYAGGAALARISQGSEGRVHFCDFVSRIKHLWHMRRVCPSEAQNRLSSFDCRSNGCSTLISDSNVEYRRAIPVEV